MASSPHISPSPAPSILRGKAWERYPWLVHGFSTRGGGLSSEYLQNPEQGGDLNLGFTAEDDPALVRANRRLFTKSVTLQEEAHSAYKLATIRQIHSAVSCRITHGDADPAGASPGDGLMTDEIGLLLGIQTADCVPVLVVEAEHRAVAAFHAGWRGTEQRIVELGCAQMRAEFSGRAEAMSAVIGPCIRSCCYAVGEDVLEKFRRAFSYAEDLFEQRSTEGRQQGQGVAHLDLVEANRRQLLDAGVPVGSIHVIGAGSEGCTSCHPGTFFSYRQSDGRTGRMLSAIGIRRL